MADWKRTQLGGISQIYSGFAFRSQDLSDKGIPVIKIANIQNKQVSPECADYFPEGLWTEKLNRYRLQADDTLIAMTGAGSVGKVGKMPRVKGRFLVNQRVAIVRPDNSRCDPTFVYFALSQDFYETTLYGLGLGAGQPNVSSKQIGELEIPFPPLPVQRRIAGFLSAYDELVENSHRRIRLLEAMAHAVYREWFVHLHFPAPDKLSDCDTGTLGDLCDLAKDAYDNALHSKLPLLDLARIPSRALAPQDAGNPSELTTSRITFKKGDTLFGAIRCYLHKVVFAPYPGVTNVSVLVLRPKRPEFRAFLAVLASGLDSIRWADQHSSGTKMPVINGSVFKTMPVPCPSPTLAAHFESVVGPMLDELCLLSIQNQNLRRTRDLLLPRLLGGQVSLNVSAVAKVAEPTALAPPLSQRDLASDEPALRAAEEAPPYRVERAGHALPPPAEPADEPPVPIDQIDRTEVLQVIRQVFSEGPPRDRDAAIRDVARALGYRRTGPRIQEILHTDLMTAVRRCIVENQNGAVRLCARSITDYDRDFLKQQFLAAIGRAWIDRDTAIRDFCRWLGFARTGLVIEDTARSLINGLLREGRLEADGAELIRRSIP